MKVAIVCIPILGAAVPAHAGPISRACVESGRKGASAQLCGCLDQVAKGELSRSDQRKAAKFFRDPQRAQEIRFSDRPKDEAFWKRYRAYTTHAAEVCS
ncbi:MAG: hypothetical protein CML68_07390 [Rhodobacteraceae bacterium]|nr:hypothetical protein [Paracoccaceae bacterium]